MNRRVSGLFGAVAIVSLLTPGCRSDPLSDLDGAPTAIITSFTNLVIDVGDSAKFTAEVVDGRSTPLATAIAFSPCDAAVATVVTDTSYHPVPATSARALVVGVSADTSCANVAGGGLTKQVVVIVN